MEPDVILEYEGSGEEITVTPMTEAAVAHFRNTFWGDVEVEKELSTEMPLEALLAELEPLTIGIPSDSTEEMFFITPNPLQ